MKPFWSILIDSIWYPDSSKPSRFLRGTTVSSSAAAAAGCDCTAAATAASSTAAAGSELSKAGADEFVCLTGRSWEQKVKRLHTSSFSLGPPRLWEKYEHSPPVCRFDGNFMVSIWWLIVEASPACPPFVHKPSWSSRHRSWCHLPRCKTFSERPRMKNPTTCLGCCRCAPKRVWNSQSACFMLNMIVNPYR